MSWLDTGVLTNVHTRHVISVMLKPKPVPPRDDLHPRTCNSPSWQIFCFASLNGLCPLHSKVKPSRTPTPSPHPKHLSTMWMHALNAKIRLKVSVCLLWSWLVVWPQSQAPQYTRPWVRLFQLASPRSVAVNPKEIKALLKSSAHVAAYYILTSTHWMENAAQDCKRIIHGV